MNHSFFKKKGPFKINDLVKFSKLKYNEKIKNIFVSDIKDLLHAKKGEITFFHSKKYQLLASKTKASFCITTNSLSKILPQSCQKLIVDNVLIATSEVTKIFYPDSVTDDFDSNVKDISKTNFKKKLNMEKMF